ncbi:conserved hypothetical protein [Lodderomyces elongisporus NRRL YB-4239]|uniref:Major facilitator superfamily (MFS) profile domain-containing protein n=1 Tax=Lodderomyces elongisporus (strain ATCC 11503 / CBS 2605 / JCM 1781 / NBRC 1676 / NRRL YB-4239) TaxID=379508 RepID=A5DRN2_LODEL|nr:conserved hypothetical protein [Lodderomyces elongisporus NRRL YB-4239]
MSKDQLADINVGVTDGLLTPDQQDYDHENEHQTQQQQEQLQQQLKQQQQQQQQQQHQPSHVPVGLVEFEGETILIDSVDWRKSRLLIIQLTASFLVFILFGLGDQAIGTLIPELQKHYKINDREISYIFLMNVTGYLVMAICSNVSHVNLGVGGVAVMGATLITSAYLAVSMKPPFAVLLISYFFAGCGSGSLDASLNSWIANLVDSNQLLGILHGCWGIGSLITPSLITFLLEKPNNPWKWNTYYILLAVIGASILILIAYTFRLETPKKYKYLSKIRHETSKHEIELDDLQDLSSSQDDYDLNEMSSSSGLEDLDNNSDSGEDDVHHVSFSEALKLPLIWGFASILFIYVGGESAFGAWLVTYLMRLKDWKYTASSHMATMFWLGLTAGRIGLGFVTAHFFKTELIANMVYIVLSLLGYIAFYMLLFTHAVILLFIVVFVTGAVVGPIFPTTIVAALAILPARLQTVGIGFICAFGGGGAAGIPSLIGLLAHSSLGLASFPGVIIVMFALLTVLWLLVMLRYRKQYKRTFI